MKILYIGKHNSGGNDDEGAISHALEVLGHKVERVHERMIHRTIHLTAGYDLCLFHHWNDPIRLRQLQCPRVFWYFDLVQYPDPTLEARCRTRVQWMNDVVPHVQLGFCTDGDWVRQDRSGKLVWLMQGADERIVGASLPPAHRHHPPADILFTGSVRNCGVGREQFLSDMILRYGTRFLHCTRGSYRERLQHLISTIPIVVAPPTPLGPWYWSNRAYNALGFGAFLLHPFCQGITRHYEDGAELFLYKSQNELQDLIQTYLTDEAHRRDVASWGLLRTKREHLYRHRLEVLLEICRGRGII